MRNHRNSEATQTRNSRRPSGDKSDEPKNNAQEEELRFLLDKVLALEQYANSRPTIGVASEKSNVGSTAWKLATDGMPKKNKGE